MGRKGIGRGKRAVLLFLQHAMAVTAVVCAAMIAWFSYYEFRLPDGSGYGVMEFPWEPEGGFEDGYLMNRYLRDSVPSIVRMAVIKNQLETNGVYNGKKKIDIYSYVNRRNDMNLKQDIQAEYYLEDLIKWNEYGFEYEELYEPLSERGDFFRIEDEEGNDYKQSYNITIKEAEREVTYSKIEVEEAASEKADEKDGLSGKTAVAAEPSGDSAAETGPSGSGSAEADSESMDAASTPDYYALESHRVLKERYQTADGRNIKNYVIDWEGYNEYCAILEAASYQLSLNYAEYKHMNENYGADQSNLRYCIQIPGHSEGEYLYFTNIDPVDMEEDITAFFKNYGKYFYYYPEHLEFETNTGLSEDYVRATMNNYEYVYPENSKIWVAVDTDYPVKDFLWQNKQKYESFASHYMLCLGILAASVLAYFVLWVYLTVKEGKPCKIAEEGEKTKIILRQFDRIPSELLFLWMFAVGAAVYAGILGIEYLVFDSEHATVGLVGSSAAALALFTSVCTMSVYYSLVRRLKAHVFWKHTLIAWLFGRLWKGFKKAGGTVRKAALAVSNDNNIFIRVVVPYVLFLAINAAAGLAAFCLLVDSHIVFLLPLALLIVLDTAAVVVQFRENRTRKRIVEGIEEITRGNLEYQIKTDKMYGDNLVLAQAVNSIGAGIRSAVETSMKDERLKADLITNVSHDIKTPLTSIINYVDLIKRENIQDEKIKSYIQVLDNKSQRLKQLTEDLVEASKISSGNIEYHLECINFVELIHQTLGEFSEKFEEKNLTVMAGFPEEPMPIIADSRRIWRVMENLYNNIYKYAMPGTRVYMDMVRSVKDGDETVLFSLKNISAQALNINADELTERFIRGDVSRSTEGSGLGLSIAKNLTQAQGGSFTIYLDGDLFKVILEFPLKKQE